MDEPVVGTSLWKDAWKRLKRNRLAVLGMGVVSFVIIASALGPPIIRLMTGYTYDYIPSDPKLLVSLPPLTAPDGSFSWTHPMGTDDAGRDILARVLLGGTHLADGRDHLDVGLAHHRDHLRRNRGVSRRQG